MGNLYTWIIIDVYYLLNTGSCLGKNSRWPHYKEWDKYRILLIRAAVEDKEKCAKCGLCELNCPYRAITVNDDGAEVDEILCRGCGACLANCPSEAITLRYYREPQYEKQIDAILEEL